VEKIIPKYAPATENDVQEYIGNVRKFVAEYRGENYTGTGSSDDITYSIKPSFKAKTGYDFDVYDKIKNESMELVSNCSIAINLAQCLIDKTDKFNTNNTEYEWQIGANRTAAWEVVFYDFLGDYEACLDSLFSNCYCNLTSIDDISGHGISSPALFEIKLEKTVYGDTEVSMIHNGKEMQREILKQEYPSMTSDPNMVNECNEATYGISYDKKGVLDSITLNGSCASGALPWMYTSNSRMLNYDDPASGRMLSFIEESKYADFDNAGIGRCLARYYPDQLELFTVKSKDSYFIHDRFENTTGFANISIEFGLEFPDLAPPPPIEGLSVYNKDNDEGTLIVQWNKSDAPDLSHYNVYCDGNAFNDVRNMNATWKVIPKNDNQTLKIKTGLCKDKNLTDDKTYHLAVTGIDLSGNENQTANADYGVSWDDLAPGKVNIKTAGSGYQEGMLSRLNSTGGNITIEWQAPSKNFDNNTPINDADWGFIIYYGEAGGIGLPQLPDYLEEYYCGQHADECYYLDSSYNSFNLTGLDDNKSYDIAVVAIDDGPRESGQVPKFNYITDLTADYIEMYDGLELHDQLYVYS